MSNTSASVTDGALVVRARTGDGAAFEALVRRHYRAAFAVALAILANRADAEDVCQDGFLRALERLDDCRDPERFGPWLAQIVRNRARNYLEYRAVRATVDLDLVPAATEARGQIASEQAELRDLLEEALGQLSEVQRQVVLLHDMDGWKHREIADVLGLTDNGSRQHLFQARKLLRTSLGRHAIREYLHD